MQLIHFLPKNEVLQKHIEHYHTLNYEEKNIKQEVFLYPHYLHHLFLQDRFSTTFSDNKLTYQEYFPRKMHFNILGRFTKPILANLNGQIKALTIVFKPAGINFFCDKTLDELAPDIHAEFHEWNSHADELRELLYCQNIDELTDKLETVLLSLYRPFDNELLFATLSLLHSDFTKYNVEEIARQLKVNRKTLLRLFKKHIGLSITDYRRILRFREALKNYPMTPNLTKLAYECFFCDQSHFIKDFQKLTGESPKKVFDEAGFIENTPFFLKVSG